MTAFDYTEEEQMTIKYMKDVYEIVINDFNYVNHTKKLTGYILFSKEMYKTRTACNSKQMAKEWKSSNADVRQFYIDMAKKFCPHKIKRKKKKNKGKHWKKKNKKNKDIFKFKIKKINNKLRKVVIDEQEYIVDCFNNIISSVEGDIGYINGFDVVVLDDKDEQKAAKKAKNKFKNLLMQRGRLGEARQCRKPQIVNIAQMGLDTIDENISL